MENIRVRYHRLISEGNSLALKKIVDFDKKLILKSSESDRLRAFCNFIVENLEKDSLTAKELINRLCILDKMFASEINSVFFINENTGKRYQSMSSESHYEVILLHSLEKLGLTYHKERLLDRSTLIRISEIIWH